MTKAMDTREALASVLTNTTCHTHGDIQRELLKHNIHITQASVSRALARIGAVKTHQPDGTIAYRLHKGTVIYNSSSPKVTRTAIAHHMAERLIANGSVIVILGKPDSGRYLGTYVDDAALPSIAGTIAGGNTLLVIPYSLKTYLKTCSEVQQLFPNTPLIQNA